MNPRPWLAIHFLIQIIAGRGCCIRSRSFIAFPKFRVPAAIYLLLRGSRIRVHTIQVFGWLFLVHFSSFYL